MYVTWIKRTVTMGFCQLVYFLNRSVVSKYAGLQVPLLLPGTSAVFVRASEWSKRKLCFNCSSYKIAVVLNCPRKYTTFTIKMATGFKLICRVVCSSLVQ